VRVIPNRTAISSAFAWEEARHDDTAKRQASVSSCLASAAEYLRTWIGLFRVNWCCVMRQLFVTLLSYSVEQKSANIGSSTSDLSTKSSDVR
jgi:hypothetical protein